MLSATHRQMMLNACTHFVVKDLRPMYALEGDGLRDLLSTFQFMCNVYAPNDLEELKYFLPSRETVTSNIHTLATKVKCVIKKELSGIFGEFGPGGALSLDIWSDSYMQQSYLGIVAHYIDESFELKYRVIANEYMSSKRKKDCKYIQEKLNGILPKFEIGDMSKVVFVRDRGSNVLAAVREQNNVSCADHFIDNTVEQSFSDGRPKVVLSKGKKAVKYNILRSQEKMTSSIRH